MYIFLIILVSLFIIITHSNYTFICNIFSICNICKESKIMFKTGISSACFYPQTTEESVLKLCNAGIKNIEIFFNSPSELSDSYIKELTSVKNYFSVNIPSVHPFMSFAETFFLFSDYERRFYDSLDIYKRFFEVTNRLGAEIFIFHGLKEPGKIDDNLYFDRFARLIELGKEYNVKVCQENVVLYKSQYESFLTKMRDCIGPDFNMVLDIKQAYKAGEDPFLLFSSLSESISHIHISDHNNLSPCIPPLEGVFDFRKFFNMLKEFHFDGNCIIELYNHSYKDEQQIFNSYEKINKLLVDY